MKSKVIDYTKVPAFLSIKDAVRVTGLSAFSLRRGCKDGTIPHIMAGDKYMINIHLLLERDDSFLSPDSIIKQSGHYTRSLRFSNLCPETM